jgi:hypothetical protein
MDELNEINFRMSISNLEARLALVEVEIAALLREINSRMTLYPRTVEARESLDALRSKQASLVTELDQMRRAYPDIHH